MKAPFDLVEISPGRRLHALIEGPTGAPLVVFDHGAFGIYADGWWVKEKLKRDNRVLLYGRAGMGWSDPAPPGAELTAEFHVEDLRRLLTVVGAHPRLCWLAIQWQGSDSRLLQPCTRMNLLDWCSSMR